MLSFRMLKNDFNRKKSIHLIILFFIMLSALLLANGVNLILDLSSALDSFFEKAQTPHFVQMHSGEIDATAIVRWSEENQYIKKYQIAKMLTIDENNIFWGEKKEMLQNNIMDISFVVQNPQFDFLLDMKNEVIEIETGNIAVPLYFQQKFDINIGDTLLLQKAGFHREFIVSHFLRDSQMNPAIIHSKRFLINQNDYNLISQNFSEKEYLIEFRLHDLENLAEFQQIYQNSEMPQTGPAVDINLFKILNSISDGVVAGVIIIVSLLVMLIAILCLRFIILSSLEEDYREIGVMKAIGIPQNQIKRIYLYKYLYISYIAIIIGFILSIFTGKILTSNILLYVGESSKTASDWITSFLAANLIVPIIYFSLRLILKKFNKITAVDALNSDKKGSSLRIIKSLSLPKNKFWNLDIFIGLRDIFQQFKLYWILLIIFIFCTFIIVVPINFHTTISSDNFITYMGIAKSDIRIDLRQSEDIKERYHKLINEIKKDKDIKEFSAYITAKYTVLQEDGSTENINIETGDFSKFTLNYLEGKAPKSKSDIALSYANASGMDKKIGDSLKLQIDSEIHEMEICGIYQDITNGGKTAKAMIDNNPENSLWSTILIDLNPGIDPHQKMMIYKDKIRNIRVTDIAGYLQETLGNTIQQIKKSSVIAFLAGVFIAFCITLLFLKMVISKETKSIAIMLSLGIGLHSIYIQYFAKTFTILGIGIILGTILSNSFGQSLVSFFSTFIGAPTISFVHNPFIAYIAVPISLFTTIYVAILSCLKAIDNNDLIRKISE